MLHYYSLILTGNQTSYYIHRFWGGKALIQYFHKRDNSEDSLRSTLLRNAGDDYQHLLIYVIDVGIQIHRNPSSVIVSCTFVVVSFSMRTSSL
jgi:hypothetical protein